MTRAHVIGRLVLTLAKQADGAPIIDGGSGTLSGDRAGSWGGYVILPPRLWRTPKGERPPARALTVGWIGASCPMRPKWNRRQRRNTVGGCDGSAPISRTQRSGATGDESARSTGGTT